MKVLLTGATGFIGNHVLQALSKLDLELVLLLRQPSRLESVNPSTEILKGDIETTDPKLVEKLAASDVMIHLAWSGLPNYRSLHHFEDELPKQYRFIKSLVEAGLKSVLVTGTCFEYGMQNGMLNESYITQPSNSYALAKDTLRKQLESLKQEKPFALNWARLFYMYGEGQASTSLYPSLKTAVEKGDKLFNMSGGQQLRDYLPVEAVADYIVALSLGAEEYGMVNICSGQPVAVIDLVRHWISQNGWKIELNPGVYPYPDYEAMEFWGDSTKLKAILAT